MKIEGIVIKLLRNQIYIDWLFDWLNSNIIIYYTNTKERVIVGVGKSIVVIIHTHCLFL